VNLLSTRSFLQRFVSSHLNIWLRPSSLLHIELIPCSIFPLTQSYRYSVAIYSLSTVFTYHFHLNIIGFCLMKISWNSRPHNYICTVKLLKLEASYCEFKRSLIFNSAISNKLTKFLRSKFLTPFHYHSSIVTAWYNRFLHIHL
jgi:hypothetical protein